MGLEDSLEAVNVFVHAFGVDQDVVQVMDNRLQHNFLILRILAARLSSPGGLNIAQRPKHRFFSSNHRPEVKLWHKNDVFDENLGVLGSNSSPLGYQDFLENIKKLWIATLHYPSYESTIYCPCIFKPKGHATKLIQSCR